MAGSDAAQLDELKRLLRRLDKAQLPSVSGKTGQVFQQSPPAQGGDAPIGVSGATSNTTALRTIVLASGVSLIVSLSVVALLFHDVIPVRRLVAAQALSKGDDRRAPAQADSSPTGGIQHPAAITETAALRAEAATPLLQAEQTPSGAVERRAPPSDARPAAEEQTSQSPPVETPPVEKSGAAEAVPGAPAEPDATAQPSSPRLTATSEPPPAVGSLAAEPDTVPHTTAEETVAEGHALAELDADQFLRRGLLMLNSGSIGAAQLLLERAADLGNGEAAFALASTYDAAPGAPRSGPAVRPNTGLALRWYERAQVLGVDKARKRLAELNGGAAAQAGDVR